MSVLPIERLVGWAATPDNQDCVSLRYLVMRPTGASRRRRMGSWASAAAAMPVKQAQTRTAVRKRRIASLPRGILRACAKDVLRQVHRAFAPFDSRAVGRE